MEHKEPLFPSCERGWWPGIYEGLSESDAIAQVGVGYMDLKAWSLPYSRCDISDERCGFIRPKKKRFVSSVHTQA